MRPSHNRALSRMTEGIALGDCLACAQVTEQKFLYSLNGCSILRCRTCRLGQTQTRDFDAASYYTDKYFSGQQSDGYADYLAAEPVLRREFARTVAFIRRWCNGGRLLEIGCAYGFSCMKPRNILMFLELSSRQTPRSTARDPDCR